MKKYNFLRVANGIPSFRLGDIDYNLEQHKLIIDLASDQQIDFLVFPELSLTGYTLGDLFHQQTLLDEATNALKQLMHYSKNIGMTIIVGLPFYIDDTIYNCAAAINNGTILGIVPKTYLPTYNEYYETRWFGRSTMLTQSEVTLFNQTVPVGADLIFKSNFPPFYSFGIEICEDLWSPNPPSTTLALHGALIIANPSASNELISKSDYRRDLIKNQSARTYTSYIYTSSGFGESTTDVSFGGHSLITENGSVLKENERFALDNQLQFADIDIERLTYDRLHSNTFRETRTDLIQHSTKATPRVICFDHSINSKSLNRFVDPHPFVPSNLSTREIRCKEIFNIQTTGLAKRICHIGSPKAIIGISGGLDSTLALLVTVKTFDLLGRDRRDIIGVTMPGFGTTDRTYQNALDLMTSLHISQQEISISDSVLQHFKDIDHDQSIHNITYENSQARERTQILMDLSNKLGGIVIGTGDLSELALGWATYNGDHMSMYGVNVSIPKTLVRYLVEYVALNEESRNAKEILKDILETPVSPELLPPSSDGTISQKTEETVGPYELHDFFLYHLMRYGFTPEKIYYLATNAFGKSYKKETILKWLKVFYRRFFSQQFKRSALPDGPKVGSICLSPRGDWRMPSDACVNSWFKSLENML